jgi:Glyoxalase/Bleomycin resistance protein/Dioxygenase superfamily
VPDISIEVDELNGVHQRMQAAGFRIEYGPVTEPWGVTRFYVRDPFGRLVNVLEHRSGRAGSTVPEPGFGTSNLTRARRIDLIAYR